MEVNIRETKEKDFEGIFILLKEAQLADYYFSKDKFTKMLRKNKGYCYIAEDNGKIVGSAFAMHDGAFRGYIQKVAVAVEYRREKIASKLVKTTIQKLQKAGIPLIFAHIEKNNKPSIELFKKLGFKIRSSHYLMDIGYKAR